MGKNRQDLIPIVEPEVGKTYLSGKGIPFRILHRARHGQDCTHAMIVYQNEVATADAPVGTVWVISESLFIQKFKEQIDDHI